MVNKIKLFLLKYFFSNKCDVLIALELSEIKSCRAVGTRLVMDAREVISSKCYKDYIIKADKIFDNNK
jgi:hypothetical protein